MPNVTEVTNQANNDASVIERTLCTTPSDATAVNLAQLVALASHWRLLLRNAWDVVPAFM